jgi:calcium-dependent protein kinase
MQDEHNVYSVMEACRGPTVQAVLDVANGPVAEADAAFLLQQAATAIQQLHSIGVLHRDVKPDNFMFYTAEVTSPLVVIDFGLSLLLGACKAHHSKWTVGSLLYVRPWQAPCWCAVWVTSCFLCSPQTCTDWV